MQQEAQAQQQAVTVQPEATAHSAVRLSLRTRLMVVGAVLAGPLLRRRPVAAALEWPVLVAMPRVPQVEPLVHWAVQREAAVAVEQLT